MTDFLFPTLIFYLLVTEPPQIRALVFSSGALLSHVLLMLPIALLATKMLARQRGEITLPVMFMNSGFMGIPCALLFGGLESARYAVLFDQAMTITIYTLGLALAIPGGPFKGLKEVGRAPAFWAFVLAIALGWTTGAWSAELLRPLYWIGSITVPAALFAVGLDLKFSKKDIHAAVPAAALRLVASTLVGIGLIYLISRSSWIMGGLADSRAFLRMLWIQSIMPAAVFSAVLPARYGAGGPLASTIVVVSTVLFIPWFLILLWLVPESFVPLG